MNVFVKTGYWKSGYGKDDELTGSFVKKKYWKIGYARGDLYEYKYLSDAANGGVAMPTIQYPLKNVSNSYPLSGQTRSYL